MPASPQIREFLSRLQEALQGDSFVRLSLGHYKGAEKDLKNLAVRKVSIKNRPQASFTWRYKTRDIVKNETLESACDTVGKALTGGGFYTALLVTTSAEISFENIKDRKHSLKKKKAETGSAPIGHNREKSRPVAEDRPYLRRLGISGNDGKVFKNAQDKYRQINKYIEILGGLVEKLPRRDGLKIADMGAGKGYLTFALYDYLAQGAGAPPRVTGVEYRQDLVSLCNGIAAECGYEGLHFEQGTIAGYDAAGTDILIALHACDTATDDAIAKGIGVAAALIVVAPCCHKQVRRQVEAGRPDSTIGFLMRHGIFTERQCEMLTDALRALILEYHGYAVKVFEFISDAHTPKNVLIVATRRAGGQTAAKKASILAEITAAKAFFGMDYHYLERMMGLPSGSGRIKGA